MELLEFIKQPQNSAFFISIIIMLSMAVIEFISLAIGISVSEAVDNILPDFDMDLDTDVDGVDIGAGSHLLDWLNFGKVPFLVLVILFLTIYGLTGFSIQTIFFNTFQSLLPGVIAGVITVIPTAILVHFFGNFISKIIPQIETTAVKIDTLKGKIAEINIGTASFNNPAEAKVKDKYGKVHYVRVVPGDPEEKFTKGEKIVLTILEDGIFKGEKVDLDLI